MHDDCLPKCNERHQNREYTIGLRITALYAISRFRGGANPHISETAHWLYSIANSWRRWLGRWCSNSLNFRHKVLWKKSSADRQLKMWARGYIKFRSFDYSALELPWPASIAVDTCMNILSFIASTHNIIGLLTETVHDSNTPCWIMNMDVDTRKTGSMFYKSWGLDLDFAR